MKTINGILFMHRPPSQACPKGAYYSRRYQALGEPEGWAITETGVAGKVIFPNVGQALRVISELERIADAREAGE